MSDEQNPPKPFKLFISDSLFMRGAVQNFAAHEASIRKRIIAAGTAPEEVEPAVRRVIHGQLQFARAIADEEREKAYWLDLFRDPTCAAPTAEDRRAAPAIIRRARAIDARKSS